MPHEWLRELPEEETAGFIRSRPQRSAVESAMLYSATHNMIDAILHKADRATMAFALEARCPLLDKQFTEYAVRLPMSLRVHGWQKKYALRKLLSKYLPWELIVRPKTGFTPPLRDWFRTDLRELLGRFALAGDGSRAGLFSCRRSQPVGRSALARRGQSYVFAVVALDAGNVVSYVRRCAGGGHDYATSPRAGRFEH